jgi:hypothetical protein
MEPTKELADQIYRGKVERARRMSLEQKFLAGPQLFDRVRGMMAAGIRADFPDADEQRVRQIVAERLALARRLERIPYRSKNDQ